MGYTHYWEQKRSLTADEWAEACEAVRAILKDVQHVQGIALANGMGDPGTSPEIGATMIQFNGLGDDSHETFTITRKRAAGDFTKTAQKPYDLAVAACLCYFATIAESHHVTSDGRGTEWLAGLECAKRALPRHANRLDIPMPVLESDRWYGNPPGIRVTKSYDFRHCVDGASYVIRRRDGATYRFPSHDAANAWVTAPHRREYMAPNSVYYQSPTAMRWKRQQDADFRSLFSEPRHEGWNIAPPAYVRPGEMPPVAQMAVAGFGL